MKLITLEEPDKSWDEFVCAHSGLVFHTSLWGKVLKEGYGCKLRYFVLEDNDDWLLAIPGMLTGRFLKLWYSLIPYGGFIGKREYIPAFLELLIKDIRKYKIDRLQIVDPQVSQSSEIPGFVGEESYRYILDLKNRTEEDILRGYKPNLRWSIRKALNAELSVEKIKDIKEVEVFYNIYLASIRRKKGIVRYPLQLFRGIFSLVEQGKGEIFLAKHKGMVVAGLVIIYSEEVAHSFHSGSLSEYLYLRPNDLLRHIAIKEALRKGKAKFDFLSSAKNLLGLIQFKDKWGTERKNLFSLHKDLSKIKVLIHRLSIPLLRLSQKL